MKNLIRLGCRAFLLATVLAMSALATIAQQTSGYHLIDTIKIGGEGGWDALTADASAHRLYVSHGTRVVVINTETDTVVGEITNTNGVHGIAIAEKFGKGFTSNGRENTVTVFDLKTLKTTASVKTGKNPDIIIFDPVSKRVFCLNAGDNSATVIDPADDKVLGTVAFEGNPEFAVSDGKGTIFVNIESKSEVVGFDARNLAIKSRFPLKPCEEPTGLAIDPKHHVLFSACSNGRMVITNANTGKVVGNVPTGKGSDGAEFDPDTRLAFCPNGEGTLTVVGEDTKGNFRLVENVKTQARARTMAIDTKTHKLYLPTARFGEAPAATKDQPRPRAPMIPDSFVILVYGR